MPAPANLVREESTSTGTGNLTLAAVNGYVRFSDATYAFGTGGTNVFWYFISNRNAAEWEIGTGHMSDANTLVRDTVLFSSNANAAVNFSAGTKDVTNDIPAAIQAKIIAAREVLTAARTYYVRADGSDSNDGLANTSGGAFLTIQKAVNVVASLDLSIYNVTIQVGAGTYTGGISIASPFLGGSVSLIGDTTTPSNVVISHSAYGSFSLSGGVSLSLGGFKIQNSAASSLGQGILLGGGAQLKLAGNMDFGACTRAHIEAVDNAIVSIGTSYAVSGDAPAHWLFSSGASLTLSGQTISMSGGTRAFSLAFASAQNRSGLTVFNLTKSGSATGKYYDSTLNAVINVFGAGATALFGNSSGTTGTGGQYG